MIINHQLNPLSFSNKFNNDQEELYWRLNTGQQLVMNPPIKGRTPIKKKHPELISIVKNRVEDSGLTANMKNKSNNPHHGAHLSDLVKEVKTKSPEIAKENPSLSKNTIHRLFLPPRINSKESHRYKMDIPASCIPIENKGFEDNRTFGAEHSSYSQININLELFFSFYSETRVISCDNKATIPLAKEAIDRHIQSRKFYLPNQAPVYDTHSFEDAESRGESIIPSGYLVMNYKNTNRVDDNILPNGNYNTFVDTLNRKHVEIPRTGEFYIFNRSNHFYKANIETHMNDLTKVFAQFDENIRNVALIVDKNLEWDWVRSFANLLNYGRLWKDSKLTTLSVLNYLPSIHHKNPVEHHWSFETNGLAG